MFRLLYASNTDRYIDQNVVADILKHSRTNNTRLGITGILLYLDGAFMQVLEGDKEQVLKLYEKISRDSRHWNSQVIIMREGPRAFPDWSMGFQKLDPAIDTHAGAFAITKAAIEGKLDTSASIELMTMLATFYKVQTNQDISEAS